MNMPLIDRQSDLNAFLASNPRKGLVVCIDATKEGAMVAGSAEFSLAMHCSVEVMASRMDDIRSVAGVRCVLLVDAAAAAPLANWCRANNIAVCAVDRLMVDELADDLPAGEREQPGAAARTLLGLVQ
ncbi:MAG: hypothetical protein E5Y89_02635 [Mesorhizobium sp.]|nr:MAG: hypothetical protein E5Y89_02635 [Mesorhizobium sp.]